MEIEISGWKGSLAPPPPSPLRRRQALRIRTMNVVFRWSHAVGFHLFTFPGPFISVLLRRKEKRRLFFGALENGF